MDLLVLDPDIEGLGVMLADLIRANVEREPRRRSLIEEGEGAVNLFVTDADVTVGLRFGDGSLRIGTAEPNADLEIACDAETLMQMTNVPLRFGMPDSLKPEGRVIAGKLMHGQLKVKGLPRHLPLMIRLNRLVTIR